MSSPTSHRIRRGHIAVALAVAFSIGAVGTASLVEAKESRSGSSWSESSWSASSWSEAEWA